MIRLTNEIRKQIVNSVLAATNYPKMKEAILSQEKALAVKITKSALPEHFAESIKTLPKEWFRVHSSLCVCGSDRTAHSVFAHGRHSVYIELPEIIRVPANFVHPRNEEILPHFAPLVIEAKKVMEEMTATKESLEAFLLSCTTVKKVLERMPELERHIPKQVKHYPIVADTANLLSRLFKSGFDTGVPKKTKKQKI